ncbi:MAG: IS1634 family transposase, partial [Cyanobacteria bacterium REEB65]|nr:IS1634 family transposase [Cyanobacteria bacterium REEB65]
KNRTVANLTHWPPDVVEGLKILLKGGKAVATPGEIFEKVEDRHHGHVQAVLTAMQRLGLANLLGSQPSRERNLVLAMIAARILDPGSKLATTRWWHVTTLPQELGVADATEDDLYAALDWLIERQDRIEKKLVKRHLDEDSLVLYDLTSTYVEGSHCPLAELGYSRDRKRGKLQINFGLLTDSRGCPVSTTVYPGSTGDPTTMLEQVEYLQGLFGLKRIALVGDRGMISQKQVDAFKGKEGIDWITALKTPQIRTLLEQRYIQLGLFDEQNLFEFTHPEYPGERLIACRNPELAKLRAHKRQELLAATSKELTKIQAMAKKGSLEGQGEIGVRIGRIINQYKVAKHFDLEIADDSLTFRILDDK